MSNSYKKRIEETNKRIEEEEIKRLESIIEENKGDEAIEAAIDIIKRKKPELLKDHF